MPDTLEPAQEAALLPCPFCDRHLVNPSGYSAVVMVHPEPYENCPAWGIVIHTDMPERVAAWNRRASPQPEIDRLREALRLMRRTLVYGMERAERDWRNPDKAEAAKEMAEQLLTMFDMGLGFTPAELTILHPETPNGGRNG